MAGIDPDKCGPLAPQTDGMKDEVIVDTPGCIVGYAQAIRHAGERFV